MGSDGREPERCIAFGLWNLHDRITSGDAGNRSAFADRPGAGFAGAHTAAVAASFAGVSGKNAGGARVAGGSGSRDRENLRELGWTDPGRAGRCDRPLT